MNRELANNIVSILSVDPLYYRNFGVWWYAIKRQLKAIGFTQEGLSCLGDFFDPEAEAYYEGMTIDEQIGAALAFQFEHRFHKRNNPVSFTPTDERYMIFDEDAE